MDQEDPVDQEYQECLEGDRHHHHQGHLDHQEADPQTPEEQGMNEGRMKSTNSER